MTIARHRAAPNLTLREADELLAALRAEFESLRAEARRCDDPALLAEADAVADLFAEVEGMQRFLHLHVTVANRREEETT